MIKLFFKNKVSPVVSKKSYGIGLFTFFAVLIWISSAEYLFSHEIESGECHADAALNKHHCHSNGQEVDIPKYDRNLFGKWLDIDGDCQNTRHELLIEFSTQPVGFSENLCRTVRGRWLDQYSGDIFLESSKLDIDHLVPLKFAWDHGAYTWSKKKRKQFSNDFINLLAVDKSINREKGAYGPTNWLPPNEKYRCQYLIRFQRVMQIYELKFFVREYEKFQKLKQNYCQNND